MKRLSNILLFVIGFFLAACNAGKKEDVVPPEQYHNEPLRSTKRGVAFNFTNTDDALLLFPYISWNYNWAPDMQEPLIPILMDGQAVEFCPMAWNQTYNASRIRQFVQDNPSTKYLLGFNEPNLTDQCNLTPKQAAKYWPGVVALAKELNLKLVSPAMNYGTLSGYWDPIKWMDEFLAEEVVNLEDIDAISLHCYMSSSTSVVDFINKFKKYGKPIWLTEFCAWEDNVGSVNDQITYMCGVLNALELDEQVERYSWFIPRYKSIGTFPYMQMLTNDFPIQLTELGKIYCHFSTFDKKAYQLSPVRASDYVKTSDRELQIRLSSDPQDKGKEVLMIKALPTNAMIDYQIQVKDEASQMAIRYASFGDCEMAVYIDGDVESLTLFPATGDLSQWRENVIPITLSKGNHTLSIMALEGSCNLSSIGW